MDPTSPLANGHVLVTGYATAPAGTALHHTYGSVGVVLEVDPAEHRIVAAEFLVVTRLSSDFLARLCQGANLLSDIDMLVDAVRRHYLAPSASAMVVALRSAHARYTAHLGSTGDR